MQKYTTRASICEKPKSYAVLFLCLTMLILLLVFSESPAENVRRSLSLCYQTVIPAVFPFMVISSFMIKTGAHKALVRLLGKPIRLLVGCSEGASSSVLLGFLCGFPIGASSAAALYDSGEISKREFERLLIFVNNPGAAFVIGGVGIGIFNSSEIGRIVYLSVIISSLTAALFSRFFYKSDAENHSHPQKSEEVNLSLASAFTSALGDSALNTLTVSACVVFFSIPVGLLYELLRPIAPPLFFSLLSSFFEISGGCNSSVALSSPTRALMMCAFACSWSGLSVHLQVFSVCRGRNLSFSPYVISKLIQGMLSPLLAFILSRRASELSFSDVERTVFISPPLQNLIFSLFVLSALIALCRRNERDGTGI